MTRVWIVRPDVENFAALEVTDPDWSRIPELAGAPLRGDWPAVRPTLSDLSIGDFAYFGPGVIASQERVWRHVRYMLEKDVEPLPVVVDMYPFVVWNTTRVIDCLDRDRSHIKYFPGSDRVYRVLRYRFHDGKIDDAWLFKLPELIRTELFCTDRFKDLITRNRLTGLEFHLADDNATPDESLM